jgi:hypothetical protein
MLTSYFFSPQKGGSVQLNVSAEKLQNTYRNKVTSPSKDCNTTPSSCTSEISTVQT